MTEYAPEPLDELAQLSAAVNALADEAHAEWHNDYAASRIRGLIPHGKEQP